MSLSVLSVRAIGDPHTNPDEQHDAFRGYEPTTDVLLKFMTKQELNI